jgi:HSP20 family protein
MHALLRHFNEGSWGWPHNGNLFSDIDRLLGDLDPWTGKSARHASELKFDQEANAYVLTVELPGLSDQDVNVEVEDGVLSVKSKREVKAPDGYRATHRERAQLEFNRSYRLGKEIEREGIEATMKDGILTLKLPKRAAPKPLQIPVKTH